METHTFGPFPTWVKLTVYIFKQATNMERLELVPERKSVRYAARDMSDVATQTCLQSCDPIATVGYTGGPRKQAEL
jgi:hypothetical protein